MKTIIIAALIAISAAVSQAAAINVITNYFPGYVFATNGWTASADGVFIPFSVLTNSTMPVLTAANSVADGTNSDVRALLFAINDKAYTVYNATTSTNRPENTTISRNLTVSESYFNASHALQTRWTFRATLSP